MKNTNNKKQNKFKYSNLIIDDKERMSLTVKNKKNEKLLGAYKKFYNDNKGIFSIEEIKKLEDYFKTGFLFLINSTIEPKIKAMIRPIKKFSSIRASILDDSMTPILPKYSNVYLTDEEEIKVGDIGAVELISGEVYVRKITKRGKVYVELKPENNKFKTLRVNNKNIKNIYKGFEASIFLNSNFI